MMRRLVRPIAAFGFLVLPVLAHATGGVWCDVDDANLGFRFKAVSSRDGTGGWFGIEGHVETRFGKLPKHLARFEIGDRNLTEHWWGPEGVLLNVQKYDEEPFASVRLTVVTRPVDEGVYEGTYALRITADGGDEAYVTKEGKVSCGGD
ncbi:hypothetical protein [Rhizobium sp.]